MWHLIARPFETGFSVLSVTPSLGNRSVTGKFLFWVYCAVPHLRASGLSKFDYGAKSLRKHVFLIIYSLGIRKGDSQNNLFIFFWSPWLSCNLSGVIEILSFTLTYLFQASVTSCYDAHRIDLSYVWGLGEPLPWREAGLGGMDNRKIRMVRGRHLGAFWSRCTVACNWICLFQHRQFSHWSSVSPPGCDVCFCRDCLGVPGRTGNLNSLIWLISAFLLTHFLDVQAKVISDLLLLDEWWGLEHTVLLGYMGMNLIMFGKRKRGDWFNVFCQLNCILQVTLLYFCLANRGPFWKYHFVIYLQGLLTSGCFVWMAAGVQGGVVFGGKLFFPTVALLSMACQVSCGSLHSTLLKVFTFQCQTFRCQESSCMWSTRRCMGTALTRYTSQFYNTFANFME